MNTSAKQALTPRLQSQTGTRLRIPLTVKVQTLSAASGLLQQLSDSTVLVRFDGNAKLGRGGVFLNYPIKYEGRQTIKF